MGRIGEDLVHSRPSYLEFAFLCRAPQQCSALAQRFQRFVADHAVPPGQVLPVVRNMRTLLVRPAFFD